MFLTLIMFSFQLRLFERHVPPDGTPQKDTNFAHITTCMWNMLITMATVGYGDTFAKSHMGRLIALVIAVWGVLFAALFVVALYYSLGYTSSE